MRILYLLLLLLIVSFYTQKPARSDVAPEFGTLLLKSVELEFEPDQVSLLEMLSGSKLHAVTKSFRILKSQQDEASKKFIVIVAGLISDQAKPLALTFASNKKDKVASHVLVEDSDLIASTALEPIRANILELRSQHASLSKTLSQKQAELQILKTKAAELARISRLVEAQSTVANLSRKLDGLLSDQANLKQLLEAVSSQSTSARLASSEAALSRDLRLLSQVGAGAKKYKGLLLNDSKREAAERIIEQAQGLNLENLRKRANINSRNEHAMKTDSEEQELLAEEYARVHKQDRKSHSQEQDYLNDPGL